MKGTVTGHYYDTLNRNITVQTSTDDAFYVSNDPPLTVEGYEICGAYSTSGDTSKICDSVFVPIDLIKQLKPNGGTVYFELKNADRSRTAKVKVTYDPTGTNLDLLGAYYEFAISSRSSLNVMYFDISKPM